uniref:Uncharacterized protein n=1 Tax=Takifugu rubripes TaxID=31033 RepID=A0A3B5KF01_TAKRU
VDLSGRGRWWLEALKDTPDPGVYHIRDFIEEADLNPVKKTYGFKRVGRKAATLGTQSGHMLLPGAYNFPESDVPKPSFFFKACPRREVTLEGSLQVCSHFNPCLHPRNASLLPPLHLLLPPLSFSSNAPPPSLLRLQARGVSLDRPEDRVSSCKYPVTEPSHWDRSVFPLPNTRASLQRAFNGF